MSHRCRKLDNGTRASSYELDLDERGYPIGIKVPNAVGPMWGELREHSEVTTGSMSRCQRKRILRSVATLVWCKSVQVVSISGLLLYLLFRWPTR